MPWGCLWGSGVGCGHLHVCLGQERKNLAGVGKVGKVGHSPCTCPLESTSGMWVLSGAAILGGSAEELEVRPSP